MMLQESCPYAVLLKSLQIPYLEVQYEKSFGWNLAKCGSRCKRWREIYKSEKLSKKMQYCLSRFEPQRGPSSMDN